MARERDHDAQGVRLYLVRHAIAADRGSDYPDDADRPLTPEGRARFRECVAGLRALGIVLDGIATSPYLRARQTAELLAAGLDGHPRVSIMEALAVDGRPSDVMAGLARFAGHRHLALVGHAPGIGEVAARLLGCRHALVFKKGAVACIETVALPPPGPGALLWFVPPRVLRRLG